MRKNTTFELNQVSLRDGEIVLYQRKDHKDPKWQCRVRVPNSIGHVVRSTKKNDLNEAKVFAQNLWDDLRIKVNNGGTIKAKNFDELYPKFLSFLEVNVNQNKRYQDISKTIERYALDYFRKKPIDQITTKDINEFIEWRRKNPKKNERNNVVILNPSPQTIRHELSSLKRYFDWLKSNGYTKNEIEFKPPPHDRARRPNFTKQEWNVLTRNLREWIKTKNSYRERFYLVQYILILANSGIRIGEARELKWENIENQTRIENGQEVNDIILNVYGKTSNNQHVKRDVVCKSEEVKEYLNRLWEYRKLEIINQAIESKKIEDKNKTQEISIKPSLSEFVFCNRDGSKIVSFKKGFEAFLKKYNLHINSDGDRHTLYSLRHTYATFRLSSGVDIYALALNMGTSVEMIEKHYGHLTNKGNASELTKFKEKSLSDKKLAWE
jgi:integrase